MFKKRFDVERNEEVQDRIYAGDVRYVPYRTLEPVASGKGIV
jgi:hypothetical protein